MLVYKYYILYIYICLPHSMHTPLCPLCCSISWLYPASYLSWGIVRNSILVTPNLEVVTLKLVNFVLVKWCKSCSSHSDRVVKSRFAGVFWWFGHTLRIVCMYKVLKTASHSSTPVKTHAHPYVCRSNPDFYGLPFQDEPFFMLHDS